MYTTAVIAIAQYATMDQPPLVQQPPMNMIISPCAYS